MSAEQDDKAGADYNIEARTKEYNRAVRDARLAVLVLSSLAFKVDRRIGVKPDARPKLSYKGEIESFGFNETDGSCFIEISWGVEIAVGRRKYARCKADYHVGYDGLSGISEEVARLAAENLVKPATYAYFRALYANLDWAAQIGSPPLPIIKFMPRLFGKRPKAINSRDTEAD